MIIKSIGSPHLVLLFIITINQVWGFNEEDLYNKNIIIGTTMHRGAGLFCELQKVVIDLIHFDKYGIAKVSPNWSDSFFPFKDNPSENGIFILHCNWQC